MCSHHQTCAGKYLFPQTQQGLESSNWSARNQNDGARKLAQRLLEQDNQPKIFDGPEKARNISNLCRCYVVMSTAVAIHGTRDASRDMKPCDLMFLSSVGAPFLRPGLQSHRAPVAAAVKGSAQPRGATRSRIFAESMASTGERCTLRAAATGATLRQAGCVGTSASASRNPYGTSGSGSEKPSKSATATPSIIVILLTRTSWRHGGLLSLKFRRATLPAIRKDTLASPLNLDTLGEAVLSNRVLCHKRDGSSLLRGRGTGERKGTFSCPSVAMNVRTSRMIAISVAINLGSVAMILRRWESSVAIIVRTTHR